MSRAGRFSYAHALHHVTLRCNNREFLFSVPSFELFLNVLQRARAQFDLHLYNYCLMTNHVHLLFKVGKAETLSESMHWMSSRFSQRFNKQAGRRGHLWEGRFRSTLIEDDAYFLKAMTYLDLNPVRARLAVTPLEYRWTAHRALRDGDEGVLDFHPLYLDLGRDAASRYAAYMRLLGEEAKRPAYSLATKYFVGSPRFVARMEKRFGVDADGTRVRREPVCGDAMSSVISVGPRHGGGERGDAVRNDM